MVQHDPEPRRSPLHERHEALGASFTDFGGWWMPVRYGSDLAEHHAVRERAGLFDISHMAEFMVEGAGAAAFLDDALSIRASAVEVGRAKYALLLEEPGGILDDLIVYRLAENRFLIIANAGNHDVVADTLLARCVTWVSQAPDAESVAVADISDDMALIALQGPRAEEILAATAGIDLGADPLAGLRYYAYIEGMFAGVPITVARTGYTGEDGFEVLVPVTHAPALWDALLAAGSPHGLIPAGLAARDTLRLEAGMPLYGHELSRETTPAQAGLGRSVATDKPSLVGRAGALNTDPTARVLVGLVCEGRRAGRAGYAVIDPAAPDAPVGEVTSGALSPTLGIPIALAYVDPRSAAPGTALAIDVRGTAVPATVTPLPFYRRKK